MHGSEQTLGAPGEVGEPDEPVCEVLVGDAAGELLVGDRVPVLVDHGRGVASDCFDWELEVFGPEAEAGLACELGVVADDVHLGVVEEGVLVQVGGADREPLVVDDSDLGVHVDRVGERPLVCVLPSIPRASELADDDDPDE